MKQILIRSLVALIAFGLLAGCAKLHDENYYWCVVDCPEPETAQVVPPPPTPAPAPEPEPAPEPVDTLDWLVGVLFPLDSTSLELYPGAVFQLETLAQKLETGELDVDRIVLTGHADRIGTPAYNEALSRRRAEVVRDYLREKGVELPIEIRAKGQQNPVVTDCPEDMPLEKLIDCLQPNRRVSIELIQNGEN